MITTPIQPANIDEYLKRLFPISRSITGNGNRETLRVLQELVPISIEEYPSQTKAYDWTIPGEWSIRSAWIKNSLGVKLVDWSECNLHVVGYSEPVHQFMKYEQLAEIMNLFDLYVQYANCEGFGLPQVEAAACGVPVMSTDYSAMESVIRKLKGTPITPKSLYKELETGCLRAVPDNDLAAEKFAEFFSQPKSMRRRLGFETRQAFNEHYQWHYSGKKWEDYFDSVEVLPQGQGWDSPPKIREPEPKPQDPVDQASPRDLAKWLIARVLCEPERVNTFFEARLTRDLMYHSTTATTGGMYFNESSAAFDGRNTMSPFNFDMAYDQMHTLCQRRNFWEQKRMEDIKR